MTLLCMCQIRIIVNVALILLSPGFADHTAGALDERAGFIQFSVLIGSACLLSGLSQWWQTDHPAQDEDNNNSWVSWYLLTPMHILRHHPEALAGSSG